MDVGPRATWGEQPQPSEGEEPSEGETRLRYRASRLQRLVGAAPPLCVLTAMSANLIQWHGSPGAAGPPLWVWVQFIALLVLFVLVSWAQGWWFGITLTPRDAVVHGLRRRTIPWTRVADVRAEPFAGGRRVVLYETDGRRTPLRMPSTAMLSWDRAFEAKAATIRAWWLRHGPAGDGTAASGTAAAPELLTDRLPDRLRLRPTAVQVVPPVMVITLLAIESTLAGFLDGPGMDHATATSRVLGACAVVLLLAAGLLCLRRGITLTPGHLSVDGLPRRRRIAWSQVRAITVEPRRGGRRLVVTERSGRRTPLPAPRVGSLLWDHAFEVRAGIVHRFWRAGRGADGAAATIADEGAEVTPDRTAEVAPGPASRLAPYSGPRFWQRAVVGVVCVGAGWMLFLSVLVGALLLASG
ncbi:hypothetical protein [Streptomyces sp. NPDC020917]|uniref:hypothetical protein n=1 Tax=Streptomyces sp. NPDC020917 TaxID=3365102 RepID=UPI0037A18F00